MTQFETFRHPIPASEIPQTIQYLTVAIPGGAANKDLVLFLAERTSIVDWIGFRHGGSDPDQVRFHRWPSGVSGPGQPALTDPIDVGISTVNRIQVPAIKDNNILSPGDALVLSIILEPNSVLPITVTVRIFVPVR